MIIDTHVHIGQFFDRYHSAQEVFDTYTKAGVDEVFVSSTSSCVENYASAVSEIAELKRLGGDHVHPLLWFGSSLLASGAADEIISAVRWEGMKLHYLSHPWYEHPKWATLAVDIALKRGWNVLLHTGEHEQCHPLVFEDLFAFYPDVKFIMAHGRPIGEAMQMLGKYPNTYVDTAFMPAEHVAMLHETGFGGRVIFGTDYPINDHYPHCTHEAEYIAGCIETLRQRLTPEQFENVMWRNAYKLYKIN